MSESFSEIKTKPRILVVAFCAQPGKGSELGAGWGMLLALSKFADCTVLMSPRYLQRIRDWEKENELPPLEFVGVPEPWWGKYAWWHRAPRFLVYIAWLRNVQKAGTRLQAERSFDAASHVTYSVYWLPSPVGRFGIPSVWGPMGGAVTTPRSLWSLLGWRGVLDELFDLVAVRALSWLPATRRTWREVTVRVVQNQETLRQLPPSLRENTYTINHAPFVEVPHVTSGARDQGILYLSPLESRKGPRLAIEALALTPENVTLTMVGDGPERAELEALAEKRGLSNRVSFLGLIPREQVFGLLANATAIVLTGLREEGGLALTEAMLCGAPVIVLAHGGARTIAELGVDQSRVALIQPGSPEETAQRFAEAMTRFTADPPPPGGANLDRAAAHRSFQKVFENLLDGQKA